MDYSAKSRVQFALMFLALVSLSACSSSQVDDAAGSPDTVADPNAPEALASTDEVPAAPADPNAPSDPGAAPTDPSAPVAENSQLAQAPTDPAVPSDPNAVPTDPNAAPAAPVGETNQMASAPVVEAPPAPAVESSAASMDGMKYHVKRGDTLMKIAFENYGDLYRWREIYESNRSRIQNPNHVPPGTTLVLNGAGMVTIERNGEKYLIKSGDTLGVISNDVYGTKKKWKKLWENNRQLIKDPNKIYAGFYLYYHPEARLTEEVKPADESASKAKAAMPVAEAPKMEMPKVEGAKSATPDMKAAVAPAAAPVDPRAPASKQ